jgi:hypothetical protein
MVKVGEMAPLFLKQNGVFHVWCQLCPSDLSCFRTYVPLVRFAEYLGVHYATISRAVRRVEQQKK